MQYAFEPSTPEGNYVTEWIRYASSCTDASHEYHEMMAFAQLATATPGVRARFSAWPRGLGTNLYLLAVGPTTHTRKSTALYLADDVIRAAIPSASLPGALSPEGFAEQLAQRSNRAALWLVDEFSGLIKAIHHKAYMADLYELLLKVYDGRDHEYRRHSKRVKGGGKVEDVDHIVNPHLTIVGATTPAVFRSLTLEDLESGLLPRFAIVMPSSKPERKPFFAMTQDMSTERNRMVQWLHNIAEWASREPRVIFEPEALTLLDSYAQELEELAAANPEDRKTTMRQRLPIMSVKMSMLVAVGGIEPSKARDLVVTVQDAAAAIAVLRRWQGYAEQFADRIAETWFEGLCERTLEILKARGRVTMRVIAQNLKVPKKTVDEVIETLHVRGLVHGESDVDEKGRAVYYVALGPKDGDAEEAPTPVALVNEAEKARASASRPSALAAQGAPPSQQAPAAKAGPSPTLHPKAGTSKARGDEDGEMEAFVA